MSKLFLIFIAPLVCLTAQTDRFIFEGKVVDSSTTEPLLAATIRIVGTTLGTVTNQKGEFRFSLQNRSARVAVSYIGYTSDTIKADLFEKSYYLIKLHQNEIQLPGVTVTGEDPAYEIIRRAIASKEKWMARLQRFEGKAFNRTQIRTDSSIAAITEAYSTLYWNRNDSLREVITQQRQTGNMPKNVQPSRVGTIMNFNDNEIKQSGFTFIGPTAPDAFEYYDYKLLRTRSMDGFEVYDIEVIPRSKISPLFKGNISIAERSYALMEVDLRPNEAFVQPFVSLKNSRYRQSFRLYDDKFWLPVDYKFDATILVTLMGFKFPSIGIERDVVIYDYDVNPEFPDSIKDLARFTIDSSAVQYDSVYWAHHDVLPLTAEQDSAYQMLDSTQSLEKRLAPKGAAAEFLNLSGRSLGYADLWFNRVEGFHIGASKGFTNVVENLDLNGMIGYGLSDQEWKYEAGAVLKFGPKISESGRVSFGNITLSDRKFSVGISGYNKQIELPRTSFEDRFGNSIAALIDKNDAYDYYAAKGGSMLFTYLPLSSVTINGSVVSEKQYSRFVHSNYSFVLPSELYRMNPAIVDGTMNSIIVSASYTTSGLAALTKNFFSAKFQSEYTSAPLHSDFDFTQTGVRLRGKVSTMEQKLMLPPSLSVEIDGGYTTGHLPPQRYYSLGSNYYGFVSGAGLRGVHAREFYGDSYLAASIEHNFRRVLFAPLGIEWLMESNLEFILKAAGARSWLSSNVLRSPTFPAKETGGYYYEAGFAVSNILDLFRADITWRLTAPKEIVFTLGVSDFLLGFIPNE